MDVPTRGLLLLSLKRFPGMGSAGREIGPTGRRSPRCSGNSLRGPARVLGECGSIHFLEVVNEYSRGNARVTGFAEPAAILQTETGSRSTCCPT